MRNFVFHVFAPSLNHPSHTTHTPHTRQTDPLLQCGSSPVSSTLGRRKWGGKRREREEGDGGEKVDEEGKKRTKSANCYFGRAFRNTLFCPPPLPSQTSHTHSLPHIKPYTTHHPYTTRERTLWRYKEGYSVLCARTYNVAQHGSMDHSWLFFVSFVSMSANFFVVTSVQTSPP